MGTLAPAGSTGNLNVSFNGVHTSATGLKSLTLDSSALSGFMVLNQTSASSVLFVDTLNVGTTANQNIYNQSAGSSTVGSLNLGLGSGNNFYNLSGGGLEVGGLQVGVSGGGTFHQTGGSLELSGGAFSGATLTLGVNVGSTGDYKMAAGDMRTDLLTVARKGTGQFTQTGGRMKTGLLDVGNNTGSGQWNMSGGTLQASLTVGANGIFNHNSGASFAGSVAIESGGVFNLQGGSFSGLSNLAVDGGNLHLHGHNMAVEGLYGSGGVIDLPAGGRSARAWSGGSLAGRSGTGGLSHASHPGCARGRLRPSDRSRLPD